MSIDKNSYEVLNDALRSKSSVFFSGDGTDITFQSELVKVTDDFLHIENTVLPHYIRDLLKSKNFSLMVQMVRFKANKNFPLTAKTLFPSRRRLRNSRNTRLRKIHFFGRRTCHV